MHKRAIIVTGGTLDSEFVMQELKLGGFIIAVDRGLQFLHKHQVKPEYIVGDFDSVDQGIIDIYRKNKTIPIREFQPEKDASDTEIGVRLAMELGYREIDILGATGTRVDHMIANIQVLMIPFREGVRARILDKTNCISLIKSGTTLLKSKAYGSYFSLFTLGGVVENLTVSGAKYPLKNHTLVPYDSLSVSNEIQDDTVYITYDSGNLMLIEIL